MAMDRSIIEKYENDAEAVAIEIHGLSAEQLKSFPVPGKWSVQQLVVHLADCEAVFADRMKRIIAEDNPSLLSFDENKWAANLAYEKQDAATAALLLALTRKQISSILRTLPESAFSRFGTHSEAGKVTLADVLSKANNHFDHHMKFLREKREKLRK